MADSHSTVSPALARQGLMTIASDAAEALQMLQSAAAQLYDIRNDATAEATADRVAELLADTRRRVAHIGALADALNVDEVNVRHPAEWLLAS